MLVSIFCEIDDFCKLLEKENYLLPKDRSGRGRKKSLTVSEIITIVIYFHYSDHKTFKKYYNVMIRGFLRSAFPSSVSYNRFIELRQHFAPVILLFTRIRCVAKCDGTSIIDSFALRTCHVRRASSCKLFEGKAKKGKTSTGWFFGFKLHITINSIGQIISFYLTPGNVADSNKKIIKNLTRDIFGKLVGDKGYIGIQNHVNENIQVIHKLRKNMKNKLMPFQDKLLLKKRGVIETVIGILKEEFSIESTKFRSVQGFLSNICSALAAYFFRVKKPQIFDIKPLCLAA